MEIVLLSFAAICVALWVEKKTIWLAVTHSVCFAFLLVLGLFKLDSELVYEALINIFGYNLVHDYVTGDIIWAYSTYILFLFAEVLIFIAFAVECTANIASKICWDIQKLLKKNNNENIPSERRFIELSEEKIYLRLCRLLN